MSLFLSYTWVLSPSLNLSNCNRTSPPLINTAFYLHIHSLHSLYSQPTQSTASSFPSTMKSSRPLITRPIKPPPLPPSICFTKNCKLKRVFNSSIKFPIIATTNSSRNEIHLPASTHSSSPVLASKMNKLEAVEENIEKVIYGGRFMTLLGVFGSLMGSFLCFIKGCTYIVASFMEFFVNRNKVILLLVEAIDVYLLGTVMLVFGMGLYELFVSNLDIGKLLSKEKVNYNRSNLFGLFALTERPRWLEIKSVNELKTKLGHVIVMLLLIGLFDRSKKAVIQSPLDLLCFSASVLLSSGGLFLLSKLNGSK